jgi:hypothetical protein
MNKVILTSGQDCDHIPETHVQLFDPWIPTLNLHLVNLLLLDLSHRVHPALYPSNYAIIQALMGEIFKPLNNFPVDSEPQRCPEVEDWNFLQTDTNSLSLCNWDCMEGFLSNQGQCLSYCQWGRSYHPFLLFRVFASS